MERRADRRVRPRRLPVPPPLPSGVGADALAVVHGGTRALLAATRPEEVVEVLVGVVRELGGHVVPAADGGDDALPLDLGLGVYAPLLAVAPPLSVTRLTLETLLPFTVEDARTAVQRLRMVEQLADEAHVDPLTGALTERGLRRGLAGFAEGDVVVLLDLDPAAPDAPPEGEPAIPGVTLAAFGQLLRESTRAVDVVGRHERTAFVVGLRRATWWVAVDRVGEMRARWLAQSPPTTFSAGVADVTAAGAHDAVRAAADALGRGRESGGDRCEVAGDA